MLRRSGFEGKPSALQPPGMPFGERGAPHSISASHSDAATEALLLSIPIPIAIAIPPSPQLKTQNSKLILYARYLQLFRQALRIYSPG